MKATISIVDVNGNTWQAEETTFDNATLADAKHILENYNSMTKLMLKVDGNDMYFNPANIVAVYLKETK